MNRKSVTTFYMKFFLLPIILILFFINTHAQQNFFNVPSSDITLKNKTFFQQQINMEKDALQSNTTFNFGLGSGFEIGLNFNGLSIIENNTISVKNNFLTQPYNPFILFNAQKRFDLNERMGIAFGFQTGFNKLLKKNSGAYAYGNFIYRSTKNGFKVVAGTYSASNSYFGTGTRMTGSFPLGIQMGIEKSIVENKLLFQSDFISGKHNLGEVVLGLAYYMNKNWIFSSGYQIPTFHSNSIKSLVIEFTFIQ